MHPLTNDPSDEEIHIKGHTRETSYNAIGDNMICRNKPKKTGNKTNVYQQQKEQITVVFFKVGFDITAAYAKFINYCHVPQTR